MKNSEKIPVLIAEIDAELNSLEKVVEKIKKQKDITASEENLESAALRLHNFYNGCERIFRLIASDVNDFIPDSWDWHKRLLTQVALEVESVRPAIISEEVRKGLEQLLGFRHLVRNIYSFELDTKRVQQLIDLTKTIYPKFTADIRQFTHYLTELYKKV